MFTLTEQAWQHCLLTDRMRKLKPHDRCTHLVLGALVIDAARIDHYLRHHLIRSHLTMMHHCAARTLIRMTKVQDVLPSVLMLEHGGTSKGAASLLSTQQ